MLDFCPHCGKRLIRKKIPEFESHRLICSKCGYSQKIVNNYSKVKSNQKKSKISKNFVILSEKDKKLNTLPTIKIKCQNCGNDTSSTWQVQTRSADEGATQFFRCTKCNYTFRIYT